MFHNDQGFGVIWLEAEIICERWHPKQNLFRVLIWKAFNHCPQTGDRKSRIRQRKYIQSHVLFTFRSLKGDLFRIPLLESPSGGRRFEQSSAAGGVSARPSFDGWARSTCPVE